MTDYDTRMCADVTLWLKTEQPNIVGRTEAEALAKARKAFDAWQDALTPFARAIFLADALHPQTDGGYEIGAPFQ